MERGARSRALLAGSVVVAWAAASCGGGSRAERSQRHSLPRLIEMPAEAEPALAEPAGTPEVRPADSTRAAESVESTPAKAAAEPEAVANWYCYRLWEAGNPDNSTTGCAREKRQCGRERWQRAREARDSHGWHIKSELCEPRVKVTCFDYRVHDDDARTSCHPSARACERVRVANLDDKQVVELSTCAER